MSSFSPTMTSPEKSTVPSWRSLWLGLPPMSGSCGCPDFLLAETHTTGSNLVVPLSSSGCLSTLRLKPRPRKGAR